MWEFIARRALACAGLLILGTSAPVEGQGITLEDAMAYALEHNPELIAFGYQRNAARGRVVQAGLAPNPELTVALDDALGSDEFRGFDSAETTVSLGWVLERSVRERRVEAARAQASLSGIDAEILSVDVAAETARRFVTVLANQARAVTASEAVRLAEESVQVVRRRVEAGRTPQADLARAEAALATAKLARDDVEHELAAARHRLAAQWGETTPNFARVRGDPFALPGTEPFATLRRRIEQNPDIARYVTKQRLGEADLRLAEAQRKPAWEARLGLRRLESTDDQALVAGITIPLAVRDRNQGRIAEARAVIDQTHADERAARVRIETALFALYQALQHGLQRANTLREEIIPRIGSALAETRAAYELGRYSYFEWRAVQAELIEARRALIDASIDVHRNVIEIERLTGVRVARPGTKR
jgi:cobalt-zinc-cadmium efflux system outer membrane protein